MFNPFKTTGVSDKVIPEWVAPAKAPEKAAVIYYSVGPTDNGRIALVVRHGSITMNKAGARQLIKMIQASIDTLIDKEEAEDDND